MAGGSKSQRLKDMAATEAHAAPDFAAAEKGGKAEKRKPWLSRDGVGPCPVVPLGFFGKNLVFLDRGKQIVIEAPRGCGKGELTLWFGSEWLIGAFPAYGKDGEPNGKFNQDNAQTALVEDCFGKGVFNPEGKVLGRGAHRPRADEEALVLHMGRRVLLANLADARGHRSGTIREQAPGLVQIAGQEVFFPALDGLPPPADKPAEAAEAAEVLALFGRWNWAEPKAAPLLLYGWLAQAYICGALEWRAHVWLPGPTASGKSSLQKIIRALLADWVLSTADASEAAIRQILGNDTLPVSIDEAEPHDNPERVQAVMNLMKKASSGDKILRGGADHKGQEFTAQSCFLLSSVMHATLRGEDRNRIALLDMLKLPEEPEPLEMELARWRSTGRRLQRRMVEGWGRFERTLAIYKRAIGEQRYEGRWQDTYGTLLACADVLLYDLAPDAPQLAPYADDPIEGEPVVNEPGMSRVYAAVTAILPMMAKGRVEARTDTERVVPVLLSHPLPGSNGKAPEPVGTWIERALERVENVVGESHDYSSASTIPATEWGPNHAARDKLKTHGMRVVQLVPQERGTLSLADAATGDEGWRTGYLAVAYPTNKGIADIFARTDWAGDGYLQSLRKIEGTVSGRKVRFGGQNADNALLVPLAALQGEER